MNFFRVFNQEQDKSSDIEQQPPFGDRKISNIQPQITIVIVWAYNTIPFG